MFSEKTNTSADLATERTALKAIEEKRECLKDAVRLKRAAFLQQEQVVAHARTPAGVLSLTDEQIDAAERKHREAFRALAAAEAELKKYEGGDAKYLDARLHDLASREVEAQHAGARAIFDQALREQLARLRECAAAERKLDELASAAGLRASPVWILNSIAGERSAFDRWRHDICRFDRELLDAADPQRLLYEREIGLNAPSREQIAAARREEDERIARRSGAVRVPALAAAD